MILSSSRLGRERPRSRRRQGTTCSQALMIVLQCWQSMVTGFRWVRLQGHRKCSLVMVWIVLTL